MGPKRKQHEQQTKGASKTDDDFIDDPPDNFEAAMWGMLKSIKLDTKAASGRLDLLEDRVSGLETDKPHQVNQVSELAKQVESLSEELVLVKAKQSKLEAVNKHLTDELDTMKAHSMKYNLIFNLDTTSYSDGTEVQGENSVGIIRAFLSNVMGMDSSNLYIPVAHRIGKKNT